MNPTRSILKSLDQTHKNCLCTCAHEAFEQGFGKIDDVNFWAVFFEGNKKWNKTYRPVPENYHLLYNRVGQDQFPLWLDFDFVISHNKFDSFQRLHPISQKLHIPLISVEHTAVMRHWSQQNIEQFKRMRGEANVFISDWSVNNWQWNRDESTFVIPHTVDVDLFSPGDQEKDGCLVVANDLIGRGPILGWETYKKIASKYKVTFIGDTKGLSEPAKSVSDLVNAYRSAKIILNAAPLSPIPTNLLEGMSCGAVPISLNACAVPDYVSEENGFLCDNDEDFMKAIDKVLSDDTLADDLGNKARQTIIEKCNVDRWVKQWEEVIDYVTK